MPADAVSLDMPGVNLTRHGHDCTFETTLAAARCRIQSCGNSRPNHPRSRLDYERFDAAAAPGLDIRIIRRLSIPLKDEQTLALCGPILGGLCDCLKRSLSSAANGLTAVGRT